MPARCGAAACSVASPISHASGISASARDAKSGDVADVRRCGGERWRAEPSASEAHEELARPRRQPYPAPRRDSGAEPAPLCLQALRGGCQVLRRSDSMCPQSRHAATRQRAREPSASAAGRDRVQALRRPLRQGRLPGRVSRTGVPVRLRVRGVRPHVHRLHAEGVRVSRSTSTCCSQAERSRGGSAPCGRPAARCRCAGPRSSSCYERRQATLGCVNPEFSELPVGEPLSASSPQVFAQLSRSALPCRELAQRRDVGSRRGRGRRRPDLDHRRQALQLRVTEEDAEVLAHQPVEESSCRSRFEPSGAFESLMCSARRRSRPMRRVDLVQQPVERSRSVMS